MRKNFVVCDVVVVCGWLFFIFIFRNFFSFRSSFAVFSWESRICVYVSSNWWRQRQTIMFMIACCRMKSFRPRHHDRHHWIMRNWNQMWFIKALSHPLLHTHSQAWTLINSTLSIYLVWNQSMFSVCVLYLLHYNLRSSEMNESESIRNCRSTKPKRFKTFCSRFLLFIFFFSSTRIQTRK